MILSFIHTKVRLMSCLLPSNITGSICNILLRRFRCLLWPILGIEDINYICPATGSCKRTFCSVEFLYIRFISYGMRNGKSRRNFCMIKGLCESSGNLYVSPLNYGCVWSGGRFLLTNFRSVRCCSEGFVL